MRQFITDASHELRTPLAAIHGYAELTRQDSAILPETNEYSLARIEGPVKDYLTEPDRLKRFYAAIRGKVTSPGPARPVFRSNTDMLLLTGFCSSSNFESPNSPSSAITRTSVGGK